MTISFNASPQFIFYFLPKMLTPQHFTLFSAYSDDIKLSGIQTHIHNSFICTPPLIERRPQRPIQQMWGYQRIHNSQRIRPITGPMIITRTFHHFCPHRIELYITATNQKIFLRVN